MADMSFICDTCGGKVKASSEDQLIKAVREHEQKEHGKNMSETEIRRKIKQVSSS